MEEFKKGLFSITKISKELNKEEKEKIMSEINVPEDLRKKFRDGSNFLTVLKKWPGHNAFLFHQSLKSIRPDLIAVACELKWLCVSSPDQVEFREEKLSIKSLIQLLKYEISKAEWEQLYMAVTGEAGDNINCEITLNKLMEIGLIEKDLKRLKEALIGIQKDQLAKKLDPYNSLLSKMEMVEFEKQFENEIRTKIPEQFNGIQEMKDYAKVQYERVCQIVGDDEQSSLEDIFLEITILKQKPRPINLKDETTYSEIAYLREIANKEVKIEPVDFTKELKKYEAKKPEIWCLIGNPGCGKTFLAKRTALRFSSDELANIRYSISVPCRNTEWHSMETTRHESKLEIETEYISKWLCLGLPKGPNWPRDLSEQLTQSNGEGLLLIIDGLDEFTRKAPFEETLLCLLLTRQALTKATIILTSRPGAWTDISSSHELKIDRYYQVLGFSPDNRDLYFQNQDLKACLTLMERYDEMKQLSLIPVNASLFAALFKGEDFASFYTLTKLYHKLTLYMVRRELKRMGLKMYSGDKLLSDLHLDIKAYLNRIRLIASKKVSNNCLSEEFVPLVMEQGKYTSYCLGLAHEYYTKDEIGVPNKVWTFVHKGMQEFMATQLDKSEQSETDVHTMQIPGVRVSDITWDINSKIFIVISSVD